MTSREVAVMALVLAVLALVINVVCFTLSFFFYGINPLHGF